MPKIVKPLSALHIKKLAKEIGFHCGGGVPGLHLDVAAGAKHEPHARAGETSDA